MRCNNVQFYTAAVDAPPNSLAGLGASTAGRCSDGKQSVASVVLVFLTHLVPELVQPGVVKHVALFHVVVLQGVALQ